MKRKLLSPCAAGLALAVAALFVVSCGGEEDGTNEPETYKLTEPKFALANVELAFDRGDGELLGSCLAGGFGFYFDANDVGAEANGYVIPSSWSAGELLRAVRNMFDRTHSVSLTNNWETIGSPASGVTTYVAVDVSLRMVIMVDEVNGYVLDDGTCDYDFARGEGGAWHLTRWKDRSRECGCIGELTLGRMLAGYYL